MKFKNAVQKYLEAKTYKLKRKTLQDYKVWFDALSRVRFGDVDVSEINMQMVDQYIAKRSSQVGTPSINRELSSLKRLLIFCYERDILEQYPKLKFDLSKESSRERAFTAEEMKRIIKASQLPSRPDYLFPIIMVASLTGLRKIDILTLKRSEVDLSGGFIIKEHIAKKREIKTSNKPILPELHKVLSAWIKKTENIKSEWVFPSPADPTKTICHTSKLGFDKVLRDAKINDGQFRDLRRTFATNCAERGLAIEVVQELLDHENIQTTRKIYVRVNKDRLKKEMEKMQ